MFLISKIKIKYYFNIKYFKNNRYYSVLLIIKCVKKREIIFFIEKIWKKYYFFMFLNYFDILISKINIKYYLIYF